MGKLKSVVVTLAKVLAGFVAFVILAFVGLGGWMWWSDRQAAAEAAAFCAPIRPGDSLAAIKARGKAEDAIYGEPWADASYHRFRFSGWGLHECQVTVDGDRVIGTRVNHEAYD